MPIVEHARNRLAHDESAAQDGGKGLAAELIAMLDATQGRARRDGYTEEQVHEALFAVVAWIDEQAMSRPWAGAQTWRETPLQHHYFSSNRAGVDFFVRLEALPPKATEVREVYALMLAAGFEGEYSKRPRSELQAYRNTLLESLLPTRAGEPGCDILFPAAAPVDAQTLRFKPRRSLLMPALVAGVPLVLLGVLFLFYNGLLTPMVDTLLMGY
jgi:type VI secretion system protein ImpK